MTSDVTKGRAEHRSVQRQLVAGAAAILVGALIVFRLTLWPPPSAGSAEELPYWQLVVGYAALVTAILAIALAAIFGVYAIEQARLARRGITLTEQGLEGDRTARMEERAAANRRIRDALFNEIQSNWVAARIHEGTAFLRSPVPPHTSIAFSFRVYDALVVGPIWDLQDDREAWQAVSDAYAVTRLLAANAENRQPWLFSLVVGAFAALLEGPGPVSLRDCVTNMSAVPIGVT